MTRERQIEVIAERLRGSFLGQEITREGSAKPRRDLHVTQGRDVELDLLLSNDVLDRRGAFGA